MDPRDTYDRDAAADHARQLVRARADAERAVEVRDEVLAIVSHDLRGPLAVISMAADAIERRAGAEVASHVRLIRQAGAQMSRLIGDLLDVARLEAGALGVDPQPIRIAAAVDDACAALQSRIHDRGLTLALDVPAATTTVLADPERLQQILANLLDNALKYTERGAIALSATVEGDEVRVAVRDTGVGVDPDELPYLFERFWRGATGRRGGTGLGLPIVKGLVEAHGGRVGVESAPGEGTTIWFTLPGVRPDQPDQPGQPEEPAGGTGGRDRSGSGGDGAPEGPAAAPASSAQRSSLR